MKQLALLLLLLSGAASAHQSLILPVTGYYDGDTIYTVLNLPHPLDDARIRIANIDTPEKGWRAACENEKTVAVQALQWLETNFPPGSIMVVDNFDWDKYGGRIVGEVSIDGVNIGEKLLDLGYAIEYDGGTKTNPWCN